MNTKFITASVFSLISPSILQAADVVAPEEPVHVVSEVVASSDFSWSGFYFGGQIGGFSSKTSATTRDVDIPLYPYEEGKDKPWVPVQKNYMPELSGFVGGLYAGINFDLGNNFIIGLDTDILLTEKKDTKMFSRTEEASVGRASTEEPSASGSDSEDEEAENGKDKKEDMIRRVHVTPLFASREGSEAKKNSVTFNHTLKQKWTGATRVRLGLSTHRVMPYIAGGIAYGQFQDILSTVMTGDNPFNKTSDVTKMMVGYTFGGGVDFAMTDNLVARAEYRYSDFGKKKFKDEIEIKYKTNDFRAGIAYKF